jgi:hypothetical protein
MTETKQTPKVQFVDGAKLKAELIEWKKACKKAGEKVQLSDYIGECIIKIADRLSKKFNFAHYTYRDEMIGDGIESCVRYLHNYSPAKGVSAFAYITQIVFNAFIRRIDREQRHSYLKAKMIEAGNIGIVSSEGDDKRYGSPFSNDADAPHIQIITEFEAKQSKKKSKNKAAKEAREAKELGLELV